MAGPDYVNNPDAFEHEENGGQGFKRVISYGNDTGTAQPLSVDSSGVLDVNIASLGSLTVDITGDHADLDTDAGTDDHEVFAIGLPASGGHVVGGTATDPIRIDTTGTTTQPVSGTVATTVETTGTGTHAQVSVTTASTAILASNASRRGYAIHNDGNQTAYLNFGGTAVVTNFPLTNGQSWVDSGQGVYTGAVAGITSSSTADVRVVEFT
jgi:hypothetical protein